MCFLCFLWFSEQYNNSVSIQYLPDSVMVTRCVSCEVETEFLNIIT
jgi:hypothetical protein